MCVCVHTCTCPQSPEEGGHQIPGVRVADSCESLDRGLLGQQQAFLVTDPSPPPVALFVKCYSLTPPGHQLSTQWLLGGLVGGSYRARTWGIQQGTLIPSDPTLHLPGAVISPELYLVSVLPRKVCREKQCGLSESPAWCRQQLKGLLPLRFPSGLKAAVM